MEKPKAPSVEAVPGALPMSPKKFRQSPELEGLYRFIYENDLRREAQITIDKILLIRKARRTKRA